MTCGIVVCLPFCTRPVCLPVLARLVLSGKTTIPARARKRKKAAPAARYQGIGRRQPGHPARRRIPRPCRQRRSRRGLPRPGAEAPAARRDLDLPAARQRGPVRPGAAPDPRAPGAVPAARATGSAPPASWPPPPAGPRPPSGSTAATRTCTWPTSPACGTAAWTPAPSGSSSPATATRRAGPGHHRPGRQRRRPDHPLRRPLVHRAGLRRRPQHPRRRRSPQPHPPRRRAHRPVRPAHLHPGHHLVRPARPPRAGPAARRHAQPWYHAKTEPAFEDMLTQLRRTLITARISKGSGAHPTPEQTKEVLAAWHAAAA